MAVISRSQNATAAATVGSGSSWTRGSGCIMSEGAPSERRGVVSWQAGGRGSRAPHLSLDEPYLDVRVEANTEERVDLLHAQAEALEP